MVFRPIVPSSGLPNSVISKCLQPSVRLSLPLLSCPFSSRWPDGATGLRGSLVHVSPRICILQTVRLLQPSTETSVSLAVSRSPRTWPTRRRIPSQAQSWVGSLFSDSLCSCRQSLSCRRSSFPGRTLGLSGRIPRLVAEFFLSTDLALLPFR